MLVTPSRVHASDQGAKCFSLDSSVALGMCSYEGGEREGGEREGRGRGEEGERKGRGRGEEGGGKEGNIITFLQSKVHKRAVPWLC